MVKIQIVILFTSLEGVSEDKKIQIQKVVQEEYCRQYGCGKESIETSLYGGISNGKNTNDIVLYIAEHQNRLNEGLYRNRLKNRISGRLKMLFGDGVAFSGTIGIEEGELGVPDEGKSGNESDGSGKSDDNGGENDYKQRALHYEAMEPKFSFEILKLPRVTMEQIEQALARIEYEREVFEEWGLYAIMPSPICAMSFYGPPGTGKTLAAEAIASKLGKRLIRASYADIESKYHGEGPKNVGAIFLAAEQQDAVLFIDEADSLLSKRLTNVSQGSEQAINSMRSQLLICLEKFHGIVIFATNLVVNYDQAFQSRLISVKFELPDASIREEIWRAHLYPDNKAKVKLKIPLAEDVDVKALAGGYEVCGRDIRNAVVDACVAARRKGISRLTQSCLVEAVRAEQRRQRDVLNAEDHSAVKLEQDFTEVPEKEESVQVNIENGK